MATTSGTITLDSYTNGGSAGEVAAHKPLSDAFNALVTNGVLGKAGDSGQVNWSGYVAPAGGDMNQYEIFYLNDSLNNTAPIYFKIEYHSSTTNANSVFNYISFGTGSNGSGTLTNVSGRLCFRGFYSASGNGGIDATARAFYMCAGSGYVSFFGGWPTTAQTNALGGFSVVLERSRDQTGAATANGLNIAMTTALTGGATTAYKVGGTSATLAANITHTSGVFSATYTNMSAMLTSASFQAPPVMTRGGTLARNVQFDGTNNLATVIQPFYVGAALGNPMNSLILGDDTFPYDSVLTLTDSYGTSHTYRSGSSNSPFFWPEFTSMPTAVAGPAAGVCVLNNLFRYE